MIPTRIALAALFLACAAGPAATAQETGTADAEPVLEPILRYALSQEQAVNGEFVGPDDSRWLSEFSEYPKAEGVMQVACDSAAIGFLFKPLGGGGWIYGAKPKYRFHWTHAETGREKEDMYYMANTTYRLIRGMILLDRWRVDGIIDLEVRVGGETLFKTQYELVNCDEKA